MLDVGFYMEQKIENALTQKCTQHMWSAPYYFPCCPQDIDSKHIVCYYGNLRKGGVFAYNDDSPKLIVIDFFKTLDNFSILVMCEREGIMAEKEGYDPWLICKITYDGFFLHHKIGSWLEKDEADMEFVLHK